MGSTIVLVPFFLLLVIVLTVVPILLAIYVYRDAKARGMEPLLWTLLAVFAPGFIGLIIYLVVRRDHCRLMCPQCGCEVQQGFVSCPTCGQKLCASCTSCGTALRPEWKLCPQCGTEITAGEPFVPPVVVNPQTKGLGVAIGAVIALPLAFVFLAVVGFVGLWSYSANMESNFGDHAEYVSKTQIALEEFRQASQYVDLEVLTLQEAKLEKEGQNWVKEKQKGKEGVYSKTFFKAENGSINSDKGSGSYALTYAYTVVVVNAAGGMSYSPTAYNFSHCLDVENALLVENVTVTLDAGQESDTSASDYGNVFVIKHADGYSFDFQGNEDSIQTYYEGTHQVFRELTDDDGEVVGREFYDYSDEEPYCISIMLISGDGAKDAKYEIPVRYDKEYFSAFTK